MNITLVLIAVIVNLFCLLHVTSIINTAILLIVAILAIYCCYNGFVYSYSY